MKKLAKYIVIFIILISLMMQTTITIKAEGGPEGSGDSGWTSGGTIRLVEGANPAKSGWLISLAKEDGTHIDCVFVTTVKKNE